MFQYNMIEAFVAAITGILQIIACCFLGAIIDVSVRHLVEAFEIHLEINRKYLFFNQFLIHQSTRILDAVAAFEWYLLPHRERKIYQLFLHHAQQEQVLYIAKIKPLNMETSLSVSKWNLAMPFLRFHFSLIYDTDFDLILILNVNWQGNTRVNSIVVLSKSYQKQKPINYGVSLRTISIRLNKFKFS